MENNGVRINKFLSEAGFCSRREADRRVENGEITINGKVAVMGDKVLAGDEVLANGKPLTKEEEMILLVMNKPKGIVCTAEKREKNNVIDFLNYPKRVYPVGRLDKESEGLLLLTNNGDLVNKIMRAGNMHEKEYIVTVNKPVTDSFIKGMAGGVPLTELNTTTRKCKVEQLGKRKFRIILTQGLNRQIRRMCEYFGYRVAALERVRIMNIKLGELKPGEYRNITKEEYAVLQDMIRNSSSETVIPKKDKPNRQPKEAYSSKNAGQVSSHSQKHGRTQEKNKPKVGKFVVVNKNIDRKNGQDE
uniref:23S rRNA pseudouridine(2604) synthase RluF n=1 Tax=Agathobacter sp. TaxID=2021311 RepID=UPI0040575E73